MTSGPRSDPFNRTSQLSAVRRAAARFRATITAAVHQSSRRFSGSATAVRVEGFRRSARSSPKASAARPTAHDGRPAGTTDAAVPRLIGLTLAAEQGGVQRHQPSPELDAVVRAFGHGAPQPTVRTIFPRVCPARSDARASAAAASGYVLSIGTLTAPWSTKRATSSRPLVVPRTSILVAVLRLTPARLV